MSVMIQDGKPVGLFSQNEILVNEKDYHAIDLLMSKCGGQIQPTIPVPPIPKEMGKQFRHSCEEMPASVVIRIDGENVPWDYVNGLAEKNHLYSLQLTSAAGMGTLAAFLMLRENQLDGCLNFAGFPTGFPITSSSENFSGDNDAFIWPHLSGSSRLTKGWQLLQAFDNVKSVNNPVFIGILDNGFIFNPDGLAADYMNSMQVNLTNEGNSVVGTATVGDTPYHGSGIAGVATAIVNNSVGAAGIAGIGIGPANQPVGLPILFRSDFSISEIYRCLQICVAWGVDVLNMSFKKTYPKILLPIHRDWNDKFQFASNQGLIMVAAAGNDGFELPDNVIFPATRTPGVITVGALNADGLTARGNSNFGSSVDVWAPGTDIHTVPIPGNATVRWTGTSVAAPIVSGLAVLMRAINPLLKPSDAKYIIRNTAIINGPDPKANRILDGYAALLKTMGDALPAGTFEEPNDSPVNAKSLAYKGGISWEPLGETTLSTRLDGDWYRIDTLEYTDVTVTLDYVASLSFARIEMIPDDTSINIFTDFDEMQTSGKHVLKFRWVPPGNYKIKVTGNGPNYYKLNANIKPRPLSDDKFESNQNKEESAIIHMRKRTPIEVGGLYQFYMGDHEANIKSPDDVDWYHIQDIKALALTYPAFKLIKSDAPLNISLFGPDGILLNELPSVQEITIKLPEPECWIRITSAKATRYIFVILYILDKSKLPDPFIKPDIEFIPDWWPDPPYVLNDWDKLFGVQIDEGVKQAGKLKLVSEGSLSFDLLAMDGSVIGSSSTIENNMMSDALIDLKDVPVGFYLARVGRTTPPSQRFDLKHNNKLEFRIKPELNF
jgi:hypothetical protein